MKSAIIVFPGINRERDMARALKLISGHEPAMVWHAETSLPKDTDLVVVPGGFSYGDYLRCGADTPFTRGYNAGQVIRVPIAHGEGNYEADEETLKRLEGEGRVLYRYCSPDGEVGDASNINGAAHSIAGIVNDRGNVLGMMPHPENHVEDIMGCTDGRGLFAGLVAHLEKAA
jgi:phosphoribosylformylglycinamidine (FGAM) synthase-like amidotransferase family enzyme